MILDGEENKDDKVDIDNQDNDDKGIMAWNGKKRKRDVKRGNGEKLWDKAKKRKRRERMMRKGKRNAKNLWWINEKKKGSIKRETVIKEGERKDSFKKMKKRKGV